MVIKFSSGLISIACIWLCFLSEMQEKYFSPVIIFLFNENIVSSRFLNLRIYLALTIYPYTRLRRFGENCFRSWHSMLRHKPFQICHRFLNFWYIHHFDSNVLPPTTLDHRIHYLNIHLKFIHFPADVLYYSL